MLTRADLDEAVRTGIVTTAQADSLWRIRRGPSRASAMRIRCGDERFVLMRSFNEFFIALGIVLLAAASGLLQPPGLRWPPRSWSYFPLTAGALPSISPARAQAYPSEHRDRGASCISACQIVAAISRIRTTAAAWLSIFELR